MASSVADYRLKQVLVPALEKIIKNGSFQARQRVQISPREANSSKGFPCPPSSDPDSNNSVPGPLNDLSLADSELILSPLINACESRNLKITEPGLECVQRLVAHGYIRGEADTSGDAPEGFLPWRRSRS